MRKPLLWTALGAVVLVSVHAHGAERIKTVVLPVKVEAAELAEDFHPGEYVLDRMIIGMNKVDRFDVYGSGDVLRILEDNLLKTEDTTPEKAAELANIFKARLVLFPKIETLTVETRTEDKVLIKTRFVAVTVSVGGTLFDAETGKSVTIGPYPEEERKLGAETGAGRFRLSSRVVEEMLKKTLAAAAKKVRSRIYKLYPLAGKISLVADEVVTIDIGTKMGVAAGQRYVVYGMLERENPITGLPEKVLDEVALLLVEEVTEEDAKCRVTRGEKSPAAGSTVERDLRAH